MWIKIHRRSDKSRRLTKKIHLVFEGPYIIVREVRRNAYLIADEENNVVGVFNSRQIKPHREAKLEHCYNIYILEKPKDDEAIDNDIIDVETYEQFCKGIERRRMQGSGGTEDVNRDKSIASSLKLIDVHLTEGKQYKVPSKTVSDIIVIDSEDSGKEINEREEEVEGLQKKREERNIIKVKEEVDEEENKTFEVIKI